MSSDLLPDSAPNAARRRWERIAIARGLQDAGPWQRAIEGFGSEEGRWGRLALALIGCALACMGAIWLDARAPAPQAFLPAIIPLAAAGALYIRHMATAGIFILLTSMLVASALPQPSVFPFVLAGLSILGFLGGFRSHIGLATTYQERMAQAQEEVRCANALVHSFEANAKDWLWQTDRNGCLSYLSPVFGDLIGYTGAADQPSLVDLLRVGFGRTTEQRSALRVIQFNIAAGLPFSEVAFPLTTNGHERWLSLSGKPVISDGGAVIGYSGLACDLTEVRRSEAEVRQLARFDSLTSLANRSYFRDTLEEVLKQSASGGAPCALLFIDLDRFKMVNDALGHAIGDALLRNVAERLEFIVQKKGRVGRLGGDEFVAIIVDARDSKAIAALAARIIKEVSAPYTINDTQIVIGASVGLAIGPKDGKSGEQLMQNADFALYAAKENGRGTHRFYDAGMRIQIEKRQALESDLRLALMDDQLQLVYQPIFDTGTEKLTGFEALLRWSHPTLGAISPEVFIPLAEESNLIGRIGEWVIRTACRQAAEWPEEIRIAVNLSPSQFVDANLASMILNALAASGLTPERLELELTEGVFLNENSVTSSTLAKLNAMGVRLAMDDFGTGYSSLGYLRRASFSKIKIDRSFVRGVTGQNRDNVEIVRAVVTIARSLGMITTAEGAETADEVQALRELGCDQIQGFFYSEPLDADRAGALVASRSEGPVSRELTPRSARIQVLRAAELKAGKAKYQVLVRNLSQDGAMIQLETEIKAGTRVTLELAGFDAVRGLVRWTQPNRIGMAFDRPIALDNLIKLPPASAARSRTRTVRQKLA